MGISKVVLRNGTTLVDLTDDTVTAESLALGVTAHDASGELVTGTGSDVFAFVIDVGPDDWTEHAASSSTWPYLTTAYYTAEIPMSRALPDTTLLVDYQHSDNLNIFETGADWYRCSRGSVTIIADHIPTSVSRLHIVGIGVNVGLDTSHGVSRYRPPLTVNKLWQNASPTATFAAQTIALDLADYDMVWVFAGETANGATDRHSSAFAKKGLAGTLHAIIATSNNRNGIRMFTVSDTGITFDVCTYNGSTTNGYCIPYVIYGVKGVLGI